MSGARDWAASAEPQVCLTRRFARVASGNAGRKSGSTRPFSIRLSETERQSLERAAGATPLGTFIRSRLLDVKPKRASRRPVADTAALGRVLGMLGRSQLAAGIADIGAAARLGTIALTPELEAQLHAVSVEIADMRRLVLRALGVTPEVSS